MFEIPRVLALRFRAVLRRSVVDQASKGDWPALTFRSDHGVLHLFAQKGGVGVAYDHASTHPPGEMVVSSSILAQIEGKSSEPVMLERLDQTRGRARWMEGRLPRAADFTILEPEQVPRIAEVPARWQTLPNHFLASLDEAAQTAAKDSVRFALAKIQLRGKAGEIVSTDGRQLLVQLGFDFPWTDDVLVPSIRAFGIRELAQEGAVSIGQLDKRIFVRVGAWTFVLDIQDGRFPDTRGVIPRAGTEVASIEIDGSDAAFLANALPKLPGYADDLSPVTLELGSKGIVRARDRESGESTEIELSRSGCKGQEIRFVLDRHLLLRALRLGCTKVNVTGPNSPLRFDGDNRTYVAVPLSPETAIQPTNHATRVASADATVTEIRPRPLTRNTMPPSNSNGNSSNGGHSPNGSSKNGKTETDQEQSPTLDEMIDDAETMRSQLHELLGKTGRLVGNLKQFRRQSRAVHAAVQSIRDLKLRG